MRICHVITRLIIGGAQENTLLTCQGLCERCHEVHLLTGPELRAAAARAERAGAADRYSYAVCCDEPPVDVEVPETALDEPTRELLERALAAER